MDSSALFLIWLFYFYNNQYIAIRMFDNIGGCQYSNSQYLFTIRTYEPFNHSKSGN